MEKWYQENVSRVWELKYLYDQPTADKEFEGWGRTAAGRTGPRVDAQRRDERDRGSGQEIFQNNHQGQTKKAMERETDEV